MIILIVGINFISFYASSISCFKTIQPVSIVLFFFRLLQGLTAWAAAIKVHYSTKYHSQTWDVQRLLLMLQWESFVLSWFLKISLTDAAGPTSLLQVLLYTNPGWVFVLLWQLFASLWQHQWMDCQAQRYSWWPGARGWEAVEGAGLCKPPSLTPMKSRTKCPKHQSPGPELVMEEGSCKGKWQLAF